LDVNADVKSHLVDKTARRAA